MRRLVVIGAGPVGVASALSAAERNFEVILLDAGDAGASLRSWGRTRFFTPLSMNVTPLMLSILGRAAPAADAILTGPEYAEAVLRPIVSQEPLAGRYRSRHRVVAVGRRGLTRSDYPGHPLRSERPFRLLVESTRGESIIEADVVLDATGSTASPMPFGAGGVPAPGEGKVDAIRSLGELDARLPELRGRRVLLVGHGHSAANAIELLVRGADVGQVVWVVRTPNRRPCQSMANDPLPERQRVVDAANAIAENPPPNVIVERRAMVESVEARDGSIDVVLTNGHRHEMDVVAAMTGYRPSSAHLAELAIELSPVSEGTARLQRAIADVTDCLCVPSVGRVDLETGEPNYFLVGARAYGRNRTFLLQTGFAQVEALLDSIS